MNLDEIFLSKYKIQFALYYEIFLERYIINCSPQNGSCLDCAFLTELTSCELSTKDEHFIDLLKQHFPEDFL